MSGRIHRLHKVATEKIIDRRKSGCDRMSPGGALKRGKPLGGQLRRHLVHPDFGKNQNMRCVVLDRVAPGIERQRALHKTIAERFRSVSLAIPFAARVIARDVKPVAVELLEPPLDRDLPVRMLPEKSADDTEPDRLVLTWRIWKGRRCGPRSHDLADKGA